MKSARKYRETALDELSLLKAASAPQPGPSYVVRLLDHFEVSHRGSGTHICMVLEVLGDNLLRPILHSNYAGMCIPAVKNIIRQVLRGLSHLHSTCGIIHTDIKPENILMEMDPQCLQLLAEEAPGSLPYQAVSSLSLYRRKKEEIQVMRRERKATPLLPPESPDLPTGQLPNGACVSNGTDRFLSKEERQKARRKQKKKRKKEKAKEARLRSTTGMFYIPVNIGYRNIFFYSDVLIITDLTILFISY